MKILFDNNMPRQLRRSLSGREVRTAKEMQWTLLENGDLLHAAEDSGFDVMVTGDKNLSYQQNLSGRRLALIVLSTNKLEDHPAEYEAYRECNQCRDFRKLSECLY